MLRLAIGDLLDVAHRMHGRRSLFSSNNPHVELSQDFVYFRSKIRKLAFQRLRKG